jgi:hypothetical protein
MIDTGAPLIRLAAPEQALLRFRRSLIAKRAGLGG